MCHYQRGQLSPQTIRSLLLVYHSQIIESHLDEYYRALSLTMNVNDMTEMEMETEITNREYEMDLRKRRIDDWNQDHFIGDTGDEHIPSRTARMQLRTDDIERKARR